MIRNSLHAISSYALLSQNILCLEVSPFSVLNYLQRNKRKHDANISFLISDSALTFTYWDNTKSSCQNLYL